jgi:DNA polymerase-3 subunit epsilon
LALYRRIYPQLESYKLSDLIGVFDLQRALKTKAEIHCPTGRQRYHCALYDALASALLLLRLYELPEFKELSLRWLILQSASSEAARESMGQQRLF